MDRNGKNILEKIRELYYSLSAAEQKVARYALENSGGVQLIADSFKESTLLSIAACVEKEA